MNQISALHNSLGVDMPLNKLNKTSLSLSLSSLRFTVKQINQILLFFLSLSLSLSLSPNNPTFTNESNFGIT